MEEFVPRMRGQTRREETQTSCWKKSRSAGPHSQLKLTRSKWVSHSFTTIFINFMSGSQPLRPGWVTWRTPYRLHYKNLLPRNHPGTWFYIGSYFQYKIITFLLNIPYTFTLETTQSYWSHAKCNEISPHLQSSFAILLHGIIVGPFPPGRLIQQTCLFQLLLTVLFFFSSMFIFFATVAWTVFGVYARTSWGRCRAGWGVGIVKVVLKSFISTVSQIQMVLCSLFFTFHSSCLGSVSTMQYMSYNYLSHYTGHVVVTVRACAYANLLQDA